MLLAYSCIFGLLLLSSMILNYRLVCFLRQNSRIARRLSKSNIQRRSQQRATYTVFMITIVLAVTNIPQVSLPAYMASFRKQNIKETDISILINVKIMLVVITFFNVIQSASKP